MESYKRHSRLAATAHLPASGWHVRVENARAQRYGSSLAFLLTAFLRARIGFSGRGSGEDDHFSRIVSNGRLEAQARMEKRVYLSPPKWIQTTQEEVRERTSRNRNFTLRLTRFIKRLDYSGVLRHSPQGYGRDSHSEQLGPIGIITEGWFFAETGRSLLPDLMTKPVGVKRSLPISIHRNQSPFRHRQRRQDRKAISLFVEQSSAEQLIFLGHLL